MKNKIISVISFLLLVLPCAAETFFVLAPQWSEFCPPNYINARQAKGFIDSIRLGEYNLYWYNRRIQFDQQVVFCSTLEQNNKMSCYQQVKNAELQKNTTYNQRIQVQTAQREAEADRRLQRDSVYSINDTIKNLSK